MKQGAYIRILLLLTCFTVQPSLMYAQTSKAKEDSLQQVADSLKVYKDIQRFSEKNKLTKFIYKKIFKPAYSASPTPKKKQLKSKNFNNYNGRIIRSVRIEVTDPFGYDLRDTLKKPNGWIQRAGNKTHLQTTRLAVRNFLQFKKHDEFNAFNVAESERLLRQSGLFRDVMIYPYNIAGNRDSTDIIVRVIDKWTLGGRVSADLESANIRIIEKNFMGLGHEFTNGFEFERTGMLRWYAAVYSINRIGNTFINARIYGSDQTDGSANKGVEIIRPFYSPLTKYAYGLTVGDVTYNDHWFTGDSVVENKGARYEGIDGFISRSINLAQFGKTGLKDTRYLNLILSARNMRQNIRSNGMYRDTFSIYNDQNLLLGMAALSMQHYEQLNYIAKFGEVEDIPTGKLAAIVVGHDPDNNSEYIGMRFGFADITDKGYYSFFIDGGKFHRGTGLGESSLNAEITYFTPLLNIGRWKFRQFAKPRLTLGWRQPLNRSLFLDSPGGLSAFGPYNTYALNRFTLSFQTQAYAPYNFFGFRFGPVFYFSCGMLSDNNETLFSGKVFSAAGLGILIKNEMLVLNTFQVSVAFYPVAPGIKNGFRFNAFSTGDFNFRPLIIDKPELSEFK